MYIYIYIYFNVIEILQTMIQTVFFTLPFITYPTQTTKATP